MLLLPLLLWPKGSLICSLLHSITEVILVLRVSFLFALSLESKEEYKNIIS